MHHSSLDPGIISSKRHSVAICVAQKKKTNARRTRPNRRAAEVFKEFRKQYPSWQAFKAALSGASPPPAVSPAEVAVQPPKKVSVKVVMVRRRPRFEVDPEDI